MVQVSDLYHAQWVSTPISLAMRPIPLLPDLEIFQ